MHCTLRAKFHPDSEAYERICHGQQGHDGTKRAVASSPRFSLRHAFSTVTLLAPSIAHAEVQVSTVGFTSIQVKFQSGQSSTAGVKALRVRFTAQSAAGLASTACWSDDTPGRSSGIGLGRRRLCSSLASLRQSHSAPDLKSRGRHGQARRLASPPVIQGNHQRCYGAVACRLQHEQMPLFLHSVAEQINMQSAGQHKQRFQAGSTYGSSSSTAGVTALRPQHSLQQP